MLKQHAYIYRSTCITHLEARQELLCVHLKGIPYSSITALTYMMVVHITLCVHVPERRSPRLPLGLVTAHSALGMAHESLPHPVTGWTLERKRNLRTRYDGPSRAGDRRGRAWPAVVAVAAVSCDSRRVATERTPAEKQEINHTECF